MRVEQVHVCMRVCMNVGVCMFLASISWGQRERNRRTHLQDGVVAEGGKLSVATPHNVKLDEQFAKHALQHKTVQQYI